MTPKRPKVETIRDWTLFGMDKLEQAGNLPNSLALERPYSEPGLPLGTSSFTAKFFLPTWHADAQLPALLRDAIQDR